MVDKNYDTQPKRLSQGPPRSYARAWRARAPELARWAQRSLVVREDARGFYYRDALTGDVGQATRREAPTLERLQRHFAAREADDVLGLHVATRDERCRWAAADIDAHDGQDFDPKANRAYALHLWQQCREAGLDARLIDSNGRGGYRVLVVFGQWESMRDAWRLGRWLQREHARFGFAKPVEWFPKSPEHRGAKKMHLWVRVPGRHPKHPHWSRVRSAKRPRWLVGQAAINSLLRLRGSPVRIAQVVPEEFTGEPPRVARPPRRKPSLVDPDSDRELFLARQALDYLDPDEDYDDWIRVAMALQSLGEEIDQVEEAFALFDDWSSEGAKYRAGETGAKWESFQPDDGRGVGPGTLFQLAKDAGWPGPACWPLRYPVNLPRRKGAFWIVRGTSAYQAMERAGYAVIGLPDRSQPSLRALQRLISPLEASRAIIIVGARRPFLEPEPQAWALQRILGREVRVLQVPEPFESVQEWITAREGKPAEQGGTV